MRGHRVKQAKQLLNIKSSELLAITAACPPYAAVHVSTGLAAHCSIAVVPPLQQAAQAARHTDQHTGHSCCLMHVISNSVFRDVPMYHSMSLLSFSVYLQEAGSLHNDCLPA